ncbi:MAG: hypothetical protein V4574_19300, partial [Pseudomonadota bacterium]
MTDSAALGQLARQALERGDEAAAAPVLAAAAGRAGDDAQLWQWSALLHRALHQHAVALHAFVKAAALAPGDGSIAYGRALAALEAGLDAVPLFEAAARVLPNNGDVMLGLAAARFAAGDGARGIADLDAVLAGSPGWIAGHHGLARLRCLMGERDAATASLDRALAAWPGDFALWQALVQTLAQGDRFDAALDAIRRGRAAAGGNIFFDANEAVALSETGDAAGADALFARLADVDEPGFAVRRVRHLLRTGRVEAALPLVERFAVPESPLTVPAAVNGTPAGGGLLSPGRLQ